MEQYRSRRFKVSKKGSKIHIAYIVNAKVTPRFTVKAGNLHLIKRRRWPARTMCASYASRLRATNSKIPRPTIKRV